MAKKRGDGARIKLGVRPTWARPSCGDRSGVRHAEFGHPVQDLAAGHDLVSLGTGVSSVKATTEEQLVSEERVLGACLQAVARLPVPSSSAIHPDRLHMAVPVCELAVTTALLPGGMIAVAPLFWTARCTARVS